MQIPSDLKTFQAFWPYYVRDHLNATNRRLHVMGTGLSLIVLGTCLTQGLWIWLWVPFLIGYSFAWLGHFKFERNKPATYEYPWYSLRADVRLLHLTLRGHMPEEIRRSLAATSAN
jgi:hypothetical protein